VNNQILKDMETQIADKTETMRDLIAEQFRGLTHGTRELRDDVEFLTWYAMMDARDPLWAKAIATVPEGRRIVDRFLRLMGLDLEANDG
jgi:hypothetical protein